MNDESLGTDEPLTSNDQAKILVFSILTLPTIGIFMGIIPAILLTFGILMMRINKDFSHIITAVRNAKIYIFILFILFLISAFMQLNNINYIEYIYNDPPENAGDFFIASIMSFIYILATHYLFYNPLLRHSQWVEQHGIFSGKKAADRRASNTKSEVDIIRSENLKTYSVADELIKWAKLKEEGHITQQEYDEARKKLLKNS